MYQKCQKNHAAKNTNLKLFLSKKHKSKNNYVEKNAQKKRSCVWH